MAYLLFIIYLAAFSWLITKSNFIKASGLPPVWLIALFIVKVGCGVFYGQLFRPFGDDADTWEIYNHSMRVYHLLIQHPSDVADIFLDQFNKPQQVLDVFGTDQSFWNYFKDIVLIDIEVILNFFSAGNYYVNVVWYAFLTFGGYIAFYRGLLLLYPGSRISSLIAVFFVPSAFFWTSGMYKDGVLFMLFGYIVYQMARLSAKNAGPVNKAIPFIKISLFILLLFLLRNYVVLILVPCLAAWWLSVQKPAYSKVFFTGIFAIVGVAFFLVPFILPSLDFPAILANRRAEFMLLEANTSLPAQNLKPTFTGYLQTLPEALNYGFLRPYLWENKGWRYLPFALELLVFYGLLFWYFIKRFTIKPQQEVYFLFALFFMAGNWILLGYTAPITGALIRYKSIFFSSVVAHVLYFLFPPRNTLE